MEYARLSVHYCAPWNGDGDVTDCKESKPSSFKLNEMSCESKTIVTYPETREVAVDRAPLSLVGGDATESNER